MQLPRIFGKRTDTAYADAVREYMETVHLDRIRDDVYGKALSESGSPKAAWCTAHAGEMTIRRTAARDNLILQMTTPLNGSSTSRSDGTMMIRSPYKYDKIDAFKKKESYFARSVMRQTETLLRNGYTFVSDNPELIAKLHRDLALLQMHTGINLDQIVAKCVDQLSTYGIFFIHKVRTGTKRSFMKMDNTSVFSRLRFIHPSLITAWVDSYGNISSIQEQQKQHTPLRAILSGRSYRTSPGISTADIAMGVIVHPGDSVFPEPPCFQMLDDILSLRSLEETAELLVAQFSSPLLHARVGDEEHDALDNEIANIRDTIVNMAPNGFIVTPHYVKIDAVNLQSAMADLLPLITHFKNRVLTGSGSSPVSVGEGDTANRASAQSIDDALSDRCMYLAKIIAGCFTYNIIPDILMELGVGIDDLFDKDGNPTVTMVFNEMNIEKQIQQNNNATNLWQANAITHTEYRRMIKRRPVSDDEKKQLFGNLFPGSKSNAAAISSQNQPTNQHGGKSAPGAKAD